MRDMRSGTANIQKIWCGPAMPRPRVEAQSGLERVYLPVKSLESKPALWKKGLEEAKRKRERQESAMAAPTN